MDEPWHSCISKDLDEVEDLIMKSVKSDNPELTEMCGYVLGVHGKRIRPAICILSFYAAGGRDSRHAVEVGAALEIIHNATLVHDDINDQGDLRRGHKVLYKQYTMSKSIIAGDFMFAKGFNLLGESSSRIVGYVVDAASSMGAGEFDQKDFEHRPDVTEADYMSIIDGKTAKLIGSAARIGACIADAEMDTVNKLGDFAENVGLAFQIVDDALDVIGKENITGKTVGSDILEGKPTLPLIYAMEDPKNGAAIREIFESKDIGYSDVGKALSLISETGSVERCLEKAKAIAESSMYLLDDIEPSVYKTALINLARYVVGRDR